MKEYFLHIEKLRKDAAECSLVRDLATDKAKQDLFNRLADHLNALADAVELAMREQIGGSDKSRVKGPYSGA